MDTPLPAPAHPPAHRGRARALRRASHVRATRRASTPAPSECQRSTASRERRPAKYVSWSNHLDPEATVRAPGAGDRRPPRRSAHRQAGRRLAPAAGRRALGAAQRARVGLRALTDALTHRTASPLTSSLSPAMNRRRFLQSHRRTRRARRSARPRTASRRPCPRARRSTASSSGSAAACRRSTPSIRRSGQSQGRSQEGRLRLRLHRDRACRACASCEHLPKTARLMDRVTVVRTVNHKVIDEHAFATNLVHTGPHDHAAASPIRPSAPSSRTSAARPNPEVPAYMLIGYPNVSRGPGFLGAKARLRLSHRHQRGPAGFTRPECVDGRSQEARRRACCSRCRRARRSSPNMADYETAQREALRLAGPELHAALQARRGARRAAQAYGGEFGQRCLLARRLVQAGVRFIEVSHNLNFINGTGWDTHNEGQQQQHVLIRELDTALSALITRSGEQEAARQDADRRRHRVRPPGGVRRPRRPRSPGHRLLPGAGRRRPEALRRLWRDR